MTTPKRHHYLPESYLRRFARDGKFWVYDRDTATVRVQTPENTAVKRYFYRYATTGGALSNDLETELARIEGIATPVIAKIEEQEITPEERMSLSYYLALLVLRTPKFERELHELIDKAGKLEMQADLPTLDAVEDFLRDHPDAERPHSAEDFYRFVHEERYRIVPHRNEAIAGLMELAPDIAKVYATSNWAVLHTNDRSAFIATDAGLAFDTDKTTLAIADYDTPKLFPLTSKTAVRLHGFGIACTHYNVTRTQARAFNVLLAREAERFIIARDEALLRSVLAHSKLTRDTRTRITVDRDTAGELRVRRTRVQP